MAAEGAPGIIAADEAASVGAHGVPTVRCTTGDTTASGLLSTGTRRRAGATSYKNKAKYPPGPFHGLAAPYCSDLELSARARGIGGNNHLLIELQRFGFDESYGHLNAPVFGGPPNLLGV